MSARIDPATPPFPPTVQKRLDRVMPPGVPPLALFTLLARDERLFQRFMAGGLVDRGNLTLRQREIVIDRVTARCGSEYEWGVHVAFFADRVSLTPAQRYSLVHGGPDDRCWQDAAERLLIRACDALHEDCDIDDTLWGALSAAFPEPAILEILMLAGFYRTVAYLTNGTRLPPEAFAARFPQKEPPEASPRGSSG